MRTMAMNELCVRLEEKLVLASMKDGHRLQGWLRRGFAPDTWVIVVEPVIPVQQGVTNPDVVELNFDEVSELNPITK
jgi:hypothetical protein